MTIFEFTSAMFDDASTYDAAAPMTIEDATTDLANFRAEGYCMPDDITPDAYAETWNDLVFEQRFRDSAPDKMTLMTNALISVERILKQARPDKKLELTYTRETSQTVNSFTDFQRQYFGIRPREEYIYVFDLETGDLLYAVNVTADSVLTAISELMDLLSRKF